MSEDMLHHVIRWNVPFSAARSWNLIWDEIVQVGDSVEGHYQQ